MQEIWKSIEGYEGKYEISSLGRVRSLFDKNGKKRILILKPRISKNGYLYLNLWQNSKGRAKKIHRMVAETFIPNPENKETVNHKNCVKTDNRVENLEWTTWKENSQHAALNGRLRDEHGINNPMYGKHGKDCPFSKTVFQFSLDGKFIREWENVKIASQTLKISHIDSCARGERKTAGGFIWRYVR